ncbi:MAG: hypothetical protein ABH896_04540 [Candidatus Jacksonbacteria bacterium]
MSTKKLIILLIVLIITWGAASALFILTKDAGKTDFISRIVEQEQAEPEPILPVNQSGIVIPEEVYSYQGEVIEKSEGFLKIKVSALDNYIEVDQEIEARFDEQTAIVQIVVSPQVLMQNISAAEIEIGEVITVTTREDIKGRTSFRAESIRAVSQK